MTTLHHRVFPRRLSSPFADISIATAFFDTSFCAQPRSFRILQNSAEPQPVVPALPTVPVKTEGSVRRLVKAEVVDVEDDNGLPPAPFPVRHKRTKTEAGIGDQPPAKRKMEDDESDDGQPHRLPPGFGAIPEDGLERVQDLKTKASEA
eukprot:s32_g56.t1